MFLTAILPEEEDPEAEENETASEETENADAKEQ